MIFLMKAFWQNKYINIKNRQQIIGDDLYVGYMITQQLFHGVWA